jgi:hypothetical protein
MKIRAIPIIGITCLVPACSSPPSCQGISWQKAVELAKEQKQGMLSRSTAIYRDNFASDTALPAEGHGYAGVVGFKGKDGRTLVGLIDDDCYVGWTER